jgi:predicted ATPase/DNA-binding CsgD family transcriptional regulator
VSQNHLFKDLITQATVMFPGAKYDFLDDTVFSQSIVSGDKRTYLRLLEFARSLQRENPLYEAAYQQLLNLYVMNGSRLNALHGIDRRFRGLESGQASLVLISGVSGIGKTSLALVFRERAQRIGAAYVVSRCLEQESTSFALWQNVARSIATVTGVSRDQLLAPIGEGSQAKSSPHLIHEFADWLGSCTMTQPLVIVLDDLHWADSDSLELLDSLTSSIRAPLLFIATYRSEETQRGHALYDYLPKLQRNRPVEHIHLDALTEADVTRLVSACHGACSPQLAAYLYTRAEGHPFFTVELLNNLIEQDLLTQDNDGFWLPPRTTVPVPKMLQQLIMQRVNRLGEQVEKLLSAAAIAGEIWHFSIVEHILDLGEDELLKALGIALRAEIIVVEDDAAEVYRFSHGLYKHVLYTQQIARQRKRLHEQIALQFEVQFPSNVYAIAYHFYAAEQWEKAIRYSKVAAEQAAQRFANNSALQLYQQVLKAAEYLGSGVDPNIYINVYERLGRIYLTLEQRHEAEIAFSQMRTAAHDKADLVGEGRALAHLAIVRTVLYRLDFAEKTALEALKIAQQTNDSQLLARVYLSLGRLLTMRGELGEGAQYLEKAFHHARAMVDSATISDSFRYRGYGAIWTGRYIEAESFAKQALEIAQTTHDILLIANGHQLLSYVQIEAGQYVEAHHNIQSILETGAALDARLNKLSRLLNQMGYLYLELGDANNALLWDKQALEASQNQHAETTGIYETQRYSLLNIATDLLFLGKLDEALDYVSQFEAITESTDYVRFRYHNRYLLLMAELKIAQKTFEQSIEFAQQARQVAVANSVLKNIAKSHWFEGQALVGLRRFDDAIKHFNEAIEIADEIQHGSLRWKIRLSLASALIETGASPTATVQQARHMMDETSRALAQSHLEKSFRSSLWITRLEALERNPAPAKFAYPAGLTKREVEVLRLVASGATNQDVADALHISVRTVHTHVTNILNKTNCDNRTAATAFAIKHHLLST